MWFGCSYIFTSDRDGDDEIYVMNADGSNQRQLTDDDTTNWWLAWSPDGTKIAFAFNRDGNWDIYVMPAPGARVPAPQVHRPGTGQAGRAGERQW
jgi:TolB protein